jgi:hypothetical protein
LVLPIAGPASVQAVGSFRDERAIINLFSYDKDITALLVVDPYNERSGRNFAASAQGTPEKRNRPG